MSSQHDPSPAWRRIRQGALTGEVSETFAEGMLVQRIGELPGWLADAEPIKRDAHRKILRLCPGGGLPDLLAKEFPVVGLVTRMKQWCGMHRPARIHRRLKHLLPAADLPIPPSLGYVTLAGRGALWLSPLVAGRSLLHWSGAALPSDTEVQWRLLSPVLEVMVRLHRAGLAHGDFKWGNVLFDEPSGRYWLVDTDSIRRTRGHTLSERHGRDLARFLLDCEEAGVSAGMVDRLRSAYVASSGHTESQVVGSTEPQLRRLRQRHLERYGPDHRLQPP